MSIKRTIQRHGKTQETFEQKCVRVKEHFIKNPLDKVAQKCYNKYWNIKRTIEKLAEKNSEN